MTSLKATVREILKHSLTIQKVNRNVQNTAIARDIKM